MQTWLPLLKEASLVWAFVTFVAILAWTLRRDKQTLEHCRFLPLEDETDHARHS